jgi:hypothetical protein
MAIVPYGQTAIADNGGQVNDNASFGPAGYNFCERHEKKADRDIEKAADDYPNNDNGADQGAHCHTLTAVEHSGRTPAKRYPLFSFFFLISFDWRE